MENARCELADAGVPLEVHLISDLSHANVVRLLAHATTGAGTLAAATAAAAADARETEAAPSSAAVEPATAPADEAGRVSLDGVPREEARPSPYVWCLGFRVQGVPREEGAAPLQAPGCCLPGLACLRPLRFKVRPRLHCLGLGGPVHVVGPRASFLMATTWVDSSQGVAPGVPRLTLAKALFAARACQPQHLSHVLKCRCSCSWSSATAACWQINRGLFRSVPSKGFRV